MKEIVVAGGCFWGVEHYFQMIPGIKQTKVGYANSKRLNPTYEEVCAGMTDAVEAVRLLYNPQVISLEKLLTFFFRIIDPTLINQQGNDIGTQYRTGIYYTEESDETIIAQSLQKLQTKYEKRIVVENKPLRNFYDAEAYHQNYLVTNPGGYCHVDFSLLAQDERKVNKHRQYRELLNIIPSYLSEKIHPLSMLANVTALLKEHIPYASWVGFYFEHDKKLILGPFQGKPACEIIALGKGVCGTSFVTQAPLVVSDVSLFPSHIACDALSRSEIVIPLVAADTTIVGVLDLDAYTYDAFDEEDEFYLTKIVALVAKYLRKEELL